MGEAKRRAEAYGEARPHRPPLVCPKCKSIRVETTALAPTGMSHRPTKYAICKECMTVWEAYPDDWCEDVVGADSCDNCAFRPGSPEQANPAEWKRLISILRSGGEFRCHKGAPIIGKPKPDGTLETEFDKDWVQRHGRKCAGFMHLVWSMQEKGEYWLARHIEFIGAPGYDCPPLPEKTHHD